MKKDILKEFVSENRDAFDDQEPGADVLGKIQSRLGLEPAVVAPRARAIKLRYWWAAAAIIVVTVGIAVLFQQRRTTDLPIAGRTEPGAIAPVIDGRKKDAAVTAPPVVAGIAEPGKNRAAVKRHRKTEKENLNARIDVETEIAASGTNAKDWRKALQNESSSARLAAVLASGKENGLLSDSDLQTLVNTMNNDENSNVRLAALDVLKKQENREAVKDWILQSVAKQDDPVVQMELLASLSSGEATTVKQQLLDITRDPMNMDGVRNEAYAALLRSKANF